MHEAPGGPTTPGLEAAHRATERKANGCDVGKICGVDGRKGLDQSEMPRSPRARFQQFGAPQPLVSGSLDCTGAGNVALHSYHITPREASKQCITTVDNMNLTLFNAGF